MKLRSLILPFVLLFLSSNLSIWAAPDIPPDANPAAAEELKPGDGFFGISIAPSGDGVGIQHVIPGLPAEKAGLKVGDNVKTIDGRSIPDVARFRLVASSQKPGAKVPIQIERDGKKMTVELVPIKRPASLSPLRIPE